MAGQVPDKERRASGRGSAAEVAMRHGLADTAGRRNTTPAQYPIDHLRRGAPWYSGWTGCVQPDQSETRETHAVAALTITLLILSNAFMTVAWYAHLRDLNTRPWYIAALVSWGIALFEYLLQVPANRIGYTLFTIRSSRSCRK